MSYTLMGLSLPVTLRPSVALTDEELMRFSRENRPCKIERNNRGEITVMTPVGGIGSTHEAYVAASLFVWNETHGRGVAFGSNAGFNLRDGSCLSPDAAWLAIERWDALTAEEQAGYPPLCPDFVIEVRSRSDSRKLLETKVELWLDNGATLAWMIDPIEGQVVVYRPMMGPELFERPEQIVGAGPVSGFDLRTTRLWTPR